MHPRIAIRGSIHRSVVPSVTVSGNPVKIDIFQFIKARGSQAEHFINHTFVPSCIRQPNVVGLIAMVIVLLCDRSCQIAVSVRLIFLSRSRLSHIFASVALLRMSRSCFCNADVLTSVSFTFLSRSHSCFCHAHVSVTLTFLILSRSCFFYADVLASVTLMFLSR